MRLPEARPDINPAIKFKIAPGIPMLDLRLGRDAARLRQSIDCDEDDNKFLAGS